MRARNLKPGLFKNEILGVADPLLTLLFEGLWLLADRDGRLEDRPLRIKAELFPYRESLDINGSLTELASLGFISRYSCDGLAVIQVINFRKHQTPHKTEKMGILPEYENKSLINKTTSSTTVKEQVSNVILTEPLPPDSSLTDSSLTDSSLTDSSRPKMDFILPDWINPDLWEDFMQTRKKLKAVDSVRAKNSLVKELERLRAKGHDPSDLIERSIRNSWKDVFEPKQLQAVKSFQPPKPAHAGMKFL